MLRKKSITIGLLITFLVSLTASEMHAWDMIRKGDQSTVTLTRSCKRAQKNQGDTDQGFFHADGDQTESLRLQLTKFCTFAEPQLLAPYHSLLNPTPFHFTCYTFHREDVWFEDAGRPPRA
ncbi:hypothetical protein JS578_11065 [Dysgonomonadaceae bacterium zrk40]|nr:hypothetical protein JS578_11065 [Dysgonomonadaceae bacterium zrk40]